MIHTIINIGGNEIFPYIFNVADMALVVGAIMLLLDILFIDKEALFRSAKKSKKDEEKIESVENTENTENTEESSQKAN